MSLFPSGIIHSIRLIRFMHYKITGRCVLSGFFLLVLTCTYDFSLSLFLSFALILFLFHLYILYFAFISFIELDEILRRAQRDGGRRGGVGDEGDRRQDTFLQQHTWQHTQVI